jgi:energy-coupling factor transport system substrate-specific component
VSVPEPLIGGLVDGFPSSIEDSPIIFIERPSLGSKRDLSIMVDKNIFADLQSISRRIGAHAEVGFLAIPSPINDVELADGSLDAKSVALLGVLAASGAVLRLPSGGVAGFEPVFFLLIPAGRVFGRGFGFVLGALTLFVSALITGGVGPWLPFQMFGAAWIGFFAGCLPPARGRIEIALLATYGAVAALAYGLVMNLWFWPFVSSGDTTVSYVAGDSVAENLRRFWGFHVTTSFGFDIPRAAFTALFLVVAGRPVLGALRRVARRAAFEAPVTFVPAETGSTIN